MRINLPVDEEARALNSLVNMFPDHSAVAWGEKNIGHGGENERRYT